MPWSPFLGGVFILLMRGGIFVVIPNQAKMVVLCSEHNAQPVINTGASSGHT